MSWKSQKQLVQAFLEIHCSDQGKLLEY